MPAVQESAKSASIHRTIPFTPRAIALLEHQQYEQINEWVFNNMDNERCPLVHYGIGRAGFAKKQRLSIAANMFSDIHSLRIVTAKA